MFPNIRGLGPFWGVIILNYNILGFGGGGQKFGGMKILWYFGGHHEIRLSLRGPFYVF